MILLPAVFRPRQRRHTAAFHADQQPGSWAVLLTMAVVCLLGAGTARSQTPTLVQHYYTGTNAPSRGLAATYYNFRLPNKTLPGNCLIMFLDHPHGVAVSSIVDDAGNTWSTTAAVTADGGSGQPVSAAFVLPNVASGTRVITVNFNAAVAGVHAVFLEYYNVDTHAPVGSKASSTSAASPTITSGTLAPAAAASGNLLLNYAMDNVGDVGAQNAVAVTAWSPGAGWTMLGGDINNAHDTSSFAVQARVADGTNINPTLKATQNGPDNFNSLALELRAASAGTAPAPGIRIVKEQFFLNTALSVPGKWTEFFPAQGNLLAAINIVAGSTTAPITDSNGNAWTLAHTDSGVPGLQYAQNPVTSGTLGITVPLTGANSNTTLVMFDITGAATSGVLAQTVTNDGANANGASIVNNAPSITPRNANGLIVVATGFGQGPVTGLAPGAPPTALFMPVTYPGETDLDTIDNADAYAQSNYGADLSVQNYNWSLPPEASNSWNAVAVEFKSASTSSPTVPSGLTAAVVNATQINLAWNAPSGTAGVSSYFVERCQGSGCTSFSQIGSVATTTYGDSGLAAATSYSYRVRAIDSAGNTTGYSNVATATTPAPADANPPTAPAGLTATAASGSQINLAWSAATDDVGVSGYLVERCQGASCANFAQIATPGTTSFSNTGLLAGTSYSYRVRATDAAGNLSGYSNVASATTTAAADTTRPTAPTGLAATVASSSQVNLVWNASTDNVGVTGYLVSRCQGSGCSNFAQVGNATSTSYGDSGLAAATTYRYRVQATDAAGNLSLSSSTVSATTKATADTTAPTAPGGLTATAASSSQINLAWSAATDNVGVTGYRVERCQGASCTAFAQIAAPGTTTLSDTGLLSGTSYSYRVRAADAAGNLSGYSNVAAATTSNPVTTDTTRPSAPSGLAPTVISSSQINLNWTAASDNVGVTGYRVERCQGASCTGFAQIATPATTSFSDTGLLSSTPYRYRVRATDAAGNLSTYSNIASATTQAATGQGPGSVAFIQGSYATPQSPTSTVTVKYAAAQSAGDLNVVVIGWNTPASVVASVTDTMGNAYALAAGPTVQSNAVAQSIYYAKNIAGAAAGANTVTVQFSAPASYPDVRILSYTGLDRTNPLDVAVGASGNSATSDSGALTTSNANDLLVAADTVWSMTPGPGSGFTSRILTKPNGNIAEDTVVTSTGSYRATVPLSGGGPWINQLVTFRAATP